MSKTAIVPWEPTTTMREVGARSIPLDLGGPRWQPSTLERAARNAYATMIARSPPVPDELIEEAAKAIYCAATNSVPKCWRVYADHDEREQFRNMARAAARVFNGGKDD